MPNKHTIADIARLANVSKATVSRVLNHKPDVDSTTRERILRIMQEQDYVPSITASGLAGGRNRLIGMLIPEFTWPFTAEIVRGVAEIVGNTSYELVLYSINDEMRAKDHTGTIDRIMATKLTAGLLAIYPGQSPEYLSRLHHRNFPVVVIDDQYYPTRAPWAKADTPWVGTDNQLGAQLAVRHLVSLGHKRIAHIQAPMKHICGHERYQGYRQALEEAGLIIDPALVIEGDFTAVGGHAAADKFFSLPVGQQPTAIFAANDGTAYGAISAAEEHGLHVPQDVAVVGFDDIASSAQIYPPLTTVRQPFYEMGQNAIALLLSLLESSQPRRSEDSWHKLPRSIQHTISPEHSAHMAYDGQEVIHISLPVSLIVRASCGASRSQKSVEQEAPTVKWIDRVKEKGL